MSIEVKDVEYIYDYKMPFETKALTEISFSIEQGEFVGLIGHTGSGKSTLIQLINGLMTPTSGDVIINGKNLRDKKVKKSEIRKNVGLVFQYPEYQLFEETIYKDIAFGPKNLNLSDDLVEKSVRNAMELVGLDFDLYKDNSPFEMSGGQKRRIAIAGVIAMNPNILILDEPTAGLDPKGRDEILEKIKSLNKNKNMTVILVSHSMEEVANLVDRLIVLHDGKKVLDNKAREVFKQHELLEKIGLGVPQMTKLMNLLKKENFDINEMVLTVSEAENLLLKYLRGDQDD